MTFWETFVVAAFSGALGGGVTLLGQWLARRGSKQLAQEAAARQKELTDEADARQRWWEALMWVYANQANLPNEVKQAALDALNDLSTTPEQSVMLEAVITTVLGGGK